MEYRGAYTDLRDLIRLRYAAREITDLADNKTSNPLAGLLTSNFRGRGIDFAEVRVYQPGDDVRTIDWRVTARTQVAHTKLFQEEKERPVLILVDQSASMYFGSQVTFKSVLAARAAAVIAWAALERGDRVGGIVFSEQGHREVRPRRNRHAVLRLLNEIHDFNHALTRDAISRLGESPENHFSNALAEVRRVTKHGSVIFIISDFNHYTDESRVHLQPLAQSSDVIGIHISDPLEQHLPTPDVYSITNGHERSRINTGSRKHREAYELGFQQQVAAIQEEFMRVKSPLLMLNTSQSIVDGMNRQTAAMN
ncbi:MAG: DUF58 domain-containing protein [Pseudomonadales bacterium]|nr:DUF58 domain-containing protein [Pseudomonadales bacterium]MBO6595949.1 DUF58 domain-containing protein [Pseudomonadales bacterium]MBO6822432.1 DUF58 domain-containing protein [Pseudomonadales bacterium]